MKDLTELAAKIDEMTLDELMGRDDMPVTGGDCDTKAGWAKRMGVDRGGRSFKTAWDKLEKAGLVEEVRGRHAKNPRLASLILYRCPALAKKLSG